MNFLIVVNDYGFMNSNIFCALITNFEYFIINFRTLKVK